MVLRPRNGVSVSERLHVIGYILDGIAGVVIIIIAQCHLVWQCNFGCAVISACKPVF